MATSKDTLVRVLDFSKIMARLFPPSSLPVVWPLFNSTARSRTSIRSGRSSMERMSLFIIIKRA